MLVLNRSNAFTGISHKCVENVLRSARSRMQIVNDYRSAISVAQHRDAVHDRPARFRARQGSPELARGWSTSRPPRPSRAAISSCCLRPRLGSR